MGFVMVDAFRESIESKIANESKELLGADLALRARRVITAQELEKARTSLPSNTQETSSVDFFSMAAGPTGHSRLVKIVAIDRNFPFHGSFRLKLRGELKGNEIDLLHQDKQVWIYPEARVQLGVDLGEELTLETKFIVSDLIEEESGLSFQPTDLAPKLFISRAHLEETKLLGQVVLPTTLICSVFPTKLI